MNTINLLSFVETPRKFIIAELSIRKLGSSSVLIIRPFEFTRPFLYIKCRDCMYFKIEKHSTIDLDQEGKPLDSTWRALFTVQN